MASGDNHAKQIVIGQAEKMVADLQNGCAGDSHKHGEALGLIVSMITPLYEASFVTQKECEDRHVESGDGKRLKVKIGPVSVEGNITTAMLSMIPAIICTGLCVFMVGKSQNWW